MKNSSFQSLTWVFLCLSLSGQSRAEDAKATVPVELKTENADCTSGGDGNAKKAEALNPEQQAAKEAEQQKEKKALESLGLLKTNQAKADSAVVPVSKMETCK